MTNKQTNKKVQENKANHTPQGYTQVLHQSVMHTRTSLERNLGFKHFLSSRKKKEYSCEAWWDCGIVEDYSFSGLIAHFLRPLSFALFYLKMTQFSQFSVISMEFSGKLQMAFCFFLARLEKIMLILGWFESSISSPCKCQMTKLSLLLKTGDYHKG